MASKRPMAKRGQRLEDGHNMHWRENPIVRRLAVSVAEEERMSNADAFAMLLRHGIVCDGLIDLIREVVATDADDGRYLALISEAVTEKTGITPSVTTETIAKLIEESDGGSTQVLHWRDTDALHDEVMRIVAEKGIACKKDALSRFIRIGIILHGTFTVARRHLEGKWLETDCDSEAMRRMHVIYRATDAEVTQFVVNTVLDKVRTES